jgi:hypothetical protein
VIDTEERTGSTFKILMPKEAEDPLIVAVMVTEWPAKIVWAGEYKPVVDIGPVEPVPPVKPLADHTGVTGAPSTWALNCALPPSRTVDGPLIDTCAAA